MIKACVIGLSKIGLIHCNNLKRISKTKLEYVYDINSKLGSNCANKFNCKTSKNFEEILKKKEIKLFILSSPTNTHEYFLKKLIKHKKMIYCEKPILLREKNLVPITNEIIKKKIKICIGLNRRFEKAYIKMKKKLNNRKVNIMQVISRSFNINVDQSIRNGGLFMDKGFHFFDLACWFTRSTPKKIVTIAEPISTKKYLDKKDYSDAIINMKMESKTVVEFIFSRESRSGQEERIRLYGKGFKLDSNNFFKKKNLFKSWDIKHKESYYNCLKKFIYSNKSMFLKEGILTQKICEKTLESAK